MYSTALKNTDVYGKTLSIPGIRDRAYVMIGYVIFFFFFSSNLLSLAKIMFTNGKKNIEGIDWCSISR